MLCDLSCGPKVSAEIPRKKRAGRFFLAKFCEGQKRGPESMRSDAQRKISDYHHCALSATPSFTCKAQDFGIFGRNLAGVFWPCVLRHKPSRTRSLLRTQQPFPSEHFCSSQSSHRKTKISAKFVFNKLYC